MTGSAHRPARPRLLLSVFAIVSARGGPGQQSWAQETCGTTSATPLRIENLVGARALDTVVNCADGGTVEAVWGGVVTLDGPISIGSGTFLSITGEGNLAEVQGDSQVRLFDVSSSGGLSLTNLTLSGGSAARGGAIHSTSATVTLDGCLFEGNNAASGDGGAVWAEGGELTIAGGEFLGNSASGNGGAVLAVDGTVVILDGTRFEENRALLEGGALYCGGTANSTSGAAASCSLSKTLFRSNNASLEADIVYPDIWLPADAVDGGGGAAFWFVDVDITDSVFEFNYAQLAGGAIFGGNASHITIDGCTFQNNTTMGYGGAMAASSAWLGGNTLLANNSANENGGGVFMWDSAGAVEFNDTVCSHNAAQAKGGCIFTDGRGTFNPGTTMEANSADSGACIYTFGRGDVSVLGGEFTGCRATGNGGFMFASDGAVATITGGTVSHCVAERRAGVVYCSGDSYDRGGSKVTIAGGTFSNNMALELGGAIVAWGTTTGGLTPTVITITGGSFSNNTAKFYGGFIFLEELASLSCEGATISGHYAGDQGGAIYGRDATWVNSSCDLIGNGAPQGAAVYLTHTGGANFVNHSITDKLGSGVNSMYAADTSIVARWVSFLSEVDQLEDSPNRAVRLEGEASLFAEECVFSGWMGDTVIHNANPAAGSLVLDSCDFSKTSSTMVVVSPNSDAEIRNAFVCDPTIENAATVNASLVLVDRALGCDDWNACGPGQCVDSALGVLCECLAGGECMDDGGALSISVKTEPRDVTYNPDPEYFELTMGAGIEGTTPAIWNLTVEADDLALQVIPSSGVLSPGTSVTVAVVGTPLREDVGGTLMSRFVARSFGSGTADSTTGVELRVPSDFYFCQAFQYAALPDDDDLDQSVVCKQCLDNIAGSEGVDCQYPGATLASLPVREGYWRSSPASLTIHPCLNAEACGGGTQVSCSDQYCREGYCGPYCAVCKEGYGNGANYICHSCTDATSRWLIFAGCFFILLIAVFLFVTVVFLVGGLDGVGTVHRSLSRTWSSSGRALNMSFSGSSKALGTSSSGSSRAPLSSRSARLRGIVRRDKITAAACTGGPIAPSSNDTPEDKTSESHNEESPRSGDSSDNDGAVRGTGQCRRAVFAGGKQAREARAREKSGCFGLGEKVKRWASRVPMNKVKILVVVWQILTQFPSVSGVDYPASYSRFLSWIDVVNFDLGTILSASCLVATVNLYHRLLLTTLAPLALVLVLVCTYWVAKRRAGTGSDSMLARRAAWTRHMAAGLLLAFLVLTSTSTVVFQIFACDEEAVEGESYFRADYSLSCKSERRTWYQIYAGVMILVYPIGIPLLYAYILWTNRESLNPRAQADAGAIDQQAPRRPNRGTSRMDEYAVTESPAELKERLRKRSQNPDLLPSMFLWKDFGGSLYYFEVIDCGRRILLTGALIFIAPNTATQAAVACMFAFASLLGFELLRPHLDPLDSWLYRLGCVVIFLNNFLALLIKVDAAGRSNREVLGGILVAVNVLLFVAVVFATWLATHQAITDTRDGAEALGVAQAVLTFEKRAAASVRFTRMQTSVLVSTSSVASDLRRPSEGDVSRSATKGPGPAAAGSSSGDGIENSRATEPEAWWEGEKDET